MTFYRIFLVALALCGALVSGIGCTEKPLPGIEVANPDLDAESVRIVPEAGDETYQVRLLDEAAAAVDQLEDRPEGASLLDSIIVPYSRIGASITLRATFSNARTIVVSTTFGTAGTLLSGVLQVDGFQTAACFEIPGHSPSCDADEPSPDAALEVPSAPEDQEAPETEEAVIGEPWAFSAGTEEGFEDEPEAVYPMMAAPNAGSGSGNAGANQMMAITPDTQPPPPSAAAIPAPAPSRPLCIAP